MRVLLFLLFVLFLPLCAGAQTASSVDSAVRAIKGIPDAITRMSRLSRFASRILEERPGDAITVGEALRDEAGRNKNDSFKAHAGYVIAMGYEKTQDFPRALQHYLEALRLYKKLKLYDDEIALEIHLSNMYDLAGDIENMKRYTAEAWQVCNEHNLESFKSYLLDRIATVDKKEGRIDVAIDKYKEAIAIATKHNDVLGQITSLCNMGIALKSAKRYKESLGAFNDALSLADTANDAYTYCYLTNNMANLFYEMGDLATSERYALKTLELEKQVHEPGLYLDMFEVLKKIYTRQKKYPEALAYSDKLMQMKDTLLNEEKARQIQELQTKYDTKTKDEQILLQTKEIAYNRKINLFLGFSSLLLFSVGGLVYRNQRITRRLNKQITNQKTELEQLNTVKDRIFSVIGHDMRSPVNTLVSFIELFENGQISAEELSEYTDLLKSNLGYTARMMENLLNWARSQMEGYKPFPEQFDLSTVTKQVAGLLSQDAAAKGVSINNCVPTNAMVYADVNMTELLLRNLIGNAIKYSHSGNTVAVSVEAAGDKVLLRIKDDGVGMSTDQVETFNSSSAQPVNSTQGTANEKGTGLGLMLCKNFAGLMNGSIALVSTRGEGACFTVTLPAA